ncbi:MAG: hypothetical protein IPJ88_07195 [Myxococcales bacterium]|nr:MAG: hypothetical protein IPJ88_07195 [Myxococcales bacterium]
MTSSQRFVHFFLTFIFTLTVIFAHSVLVSAQDASRETSDSFQLQRKSEPPQKQTHLAPELLGSLAGGVLGAAVVGGIAAGLYVANCDRSSHDEISCDGRATILAAFVTPLGFVALAPLGGYIGGRAAQGTGKLGYAYLGELVGLLVGSIPLIFAAAMHSDALAYTGAITTTLGAIIGPVVGFELSQDNPQTKDQPKVTAGLAPASKGLGAQAMMRVAF